MPWTDDRLSAVLQVAAACPDACAADVVSLVAEVRRLREALQTIRDHYGRVCNNYELCHHVGCYSSVGAWMEADAALAGDSEPAGEGE